jgi:membrane protease YdiL (CAAX protease family)
MLMELEIFATSALLVFGMSLPFMLVGFLVWGRPTNLWPPQRNRFVPWNGFEVIAVFLAMEIVIPLALDVLLLQTGLFRTFYELTGGNFQDKFGSNEQTLHEHLNIWVTCVGLPIKIGLLALWFELAPGFSAYQLGLSRHRLWKSVMLGWLGWMVIGIPCDLFFLLLNSGYLWLFPGEPEIHTLMKLAQEHPTSVEWGLLVFSAVVAAPVMEEFFFRGILLRWLSVRPKGPVIVMGLALALVCSMRISRAQQAFWAMDWIGMVNAAAPVVFTLLVIAVVQNLDRFLEDWRALARWRAILASSLLFAIAHANVWPSPVALLLLAICLGWLATRTQSIIPGIVTHALFNAVACVQLIQQLRVL